MAVAAMASSAFLGGLQSSAFGRYQIILSSTPTPSRRISWVVCAHSQSDLNWQKEEERWLREEKRWQREEVRWLREEARWNAQRQSLEAHITSLQHQLKILQQEQKQENREEVDKHHLISSLAQLLNSASPRPQISTNSLTAFDSDMLSNNSTKQGVPKKEKEKRRTLRRGSEGEDVKEMQQALERLGFYSGEEDMEFSSFDGGTERAVKSWQATLGIVEDGTMTAELFEKLVAMEMLGTGVDESTNGVIAALSEKEGINGTVKIPAVTEVTQFQQTIRSNPEGVEVSESRVYLLGENRWEEPQRLINKQRGDTKVGTAARCLSCRGEGKMLCTECEGTGELNVEEQFLEWAEGAECPYCEGSKYIVCDLCEGKGVKL